MAKVEQRGRAQASPRAHNPQDNTVLGTIAGGQVEAFFDFANETPNVMAFHLEVEGLPPQWVSGVGQQATVSAAPFSGGTLRLALSPPVESEEGYYNFQVLIIDSDDSEQRRVSLVLRVEPSAQEPEDTTESRPDISQLLTNSNGSASLPVTPVSSPQLIVPVKPSAPTAPPPSAVAASSVIPSPQGVLTLPSHQFNAFSSQSEDDVPLMELAPQPDADLENMDGGDVKAPSESNIVNPKEGTAIQLKPGETMLLRFDFTNHGKRTNTFVIDDDRSLENTWVTLVQQQVNIVGNSSGEVSIRLHPPIDATPGNYPFAIMVGPLGGILEPCNLVLSVQATPAVKLTAKAPAVKVGPFGNVIDFNLAVESVGNADTAFRIAVKAPHAQVETEEKPQGPEDIYETPRWRYLFDKEMDNLQSPARGRPQPKAIRLRALRRGVWWFGWRESHKLRVAAVPVTDLSNGGMTGNVVELIASRWRVLPLPGFLMVPFCLLLMCFLLSAPSEFGVSNAKYRDEKGNYWVVDPVGYSKFINLRWKAQPFALLRLTGNPGELNQVKLGSGVYSSTETIASKSSERLATHIYRVSRIIGGGEQEAVVHFVATKKETPLRVYVTIDPQVMKFDPRDPRILRFDSSNIKIKVPAGGFARLFLENAAATPNSLNYWVPNEGFSEESPFKFRWVNPKGEIGWRGSTNDETAYERDVSTYTRQFIIDPRESAQSGETGEIVFITTAANLPLLRVNVELS